MPLERWIAGGLAETGLKVISQWGKGVGYRICGRTPDDDVAGGGGVRWMDAWMSGGLVGTWERCDFEMEEGSVCVWVVGSLGKSQMTLLVVL